MTFVKDLPLAASVLAFALLMVAHFECPDMIASYKTVKQDILSRNAVL
jgi:hypothetical protein